jgi:hypothetical protein
MWSWTVVYSKGGIIDPRDSGVYPMFLCGSEKEFENLLNAMTETGWLDEIPGGLLQVHDWDEHTGRVLEERTYERLKKQKQRLEKSDCPDEEVRDSPEGQIGDSPEGQNEIVLRQIKQNKTKQNKTKKRNSEEDVAVGFSAVAEAPAAPPSKKRSKVVKDGTPGTQVWEAYTQAMQEAWNLTPPRSAKSASQATKLVELVGIETALKLAAYYPTRRSDFYVRTGHPFGTLLTDYMAMLREVNAGIKLTKGVVKEIVSKEETENYCKFDQFRKETNPLLMNDEEYAEWKKEQQALAAAGLPNQLTEGDSNESDEGTVF